MKSCELDINICNGLSENAARGKIWNGHCGILVWSLIIPYFYTIKFGAKSELDCSLIQFHELCRLYSEFSNKLHSNDN